MGNLPPVDGDRREVRRRARDMVLYLESDLFKRTIMDEPTSEGYDEETDIEMVSPLGWRVRMRRRDLEPAGHGPLQVDVVIFRPGGDYPDHHKDVGPVFAECEDAPIEWLEGALP